MNKYMKLLFPLLCFQWAVNGEIIGTNDYSSDHFKAQLDGSFKKYFNDNIYKIKEYSRERRFFNRRQEESSQGASNDNPVEVLTCNSEVISNVKTCSEGGKNFSCFNDLTTTQFSKYLDCENFDVPNYGDLVNAIVLNNLRNESYLEILNNSKHMNQTNSNEESSKNADLTVEDVIVDFVNKLTIVATKNSLPYTTTHFIEEMKNGPMEGQDDEKLISTDYYNCLKLVDDDIYSADITSVCLCGYGYNKEIKGYSKDIKLNALYAYYGFSEQSFNDVCTPILENSPIFTDENKYISEKITGQSLLTLLKEYNIPNYGSVFNEMMINTLKSSTISLKKVLYDLYIEIGNVSRDNYNENEESHEFGRCVVQVVNRVLDNSGLSYCLCNAGYNSITALSNVFASHDLSEDTYNDLCSQVKEERKKKEYCNLGSKVQVCIDKVKPQEINNISISKQNYTDCLDIGVEGNDFLRQTKCLCDLTKAKWDDKEFLSHKEFLSCYGYTELSFILGCRQFYPNQMFSDNPARGIENFYSENYDDRCGDSGTGGGHIYHDPCICKVREENQEVSLELEDICSRVGTEPGTCSAGLLSYKFSGILMLFTVIISLFLYI